jgi:hypothetical protein
MHINAIADSIVLYLCHDFYNIILKIKKLYIALGSAPPPPPRKNSGCTPDSSEQINEGQMGVACKIFPVIRYHQMSAGRKLQVTPNILNLDIR